MITTHAQISLYGSDIIISVPISSGGSFSRSLTSLWMRPGCASMVTMPESRFESSQSASLEQTRSGFRDLFRARFGDPSEFRQTFFRDRSWIFRAPKGISRRSFGHLQGFRAEVHISEVFAELLPSSFQSSVRGLSKFLTDCRGG